MSVWSFLFSVTPAPTADAADWPSEAESQAADRAHIQSHTEPDYHEWLAFEPQAEVIVAPGSAHDAQEGDTGYWDSDGHYHAS
jgi:hypothetical protein